MLVVLTSVRVVNFLPVLFKPTMSYTTRMREQKVHEILTFLQRCNQLKSVRRYGVTLKKDYDTVAEHSWRLALMAQIIATECNVHVDLLHVLGIALVHDLAESVTGDYDAYDVITGKKSLSEKHTEEQQAMKEITDGISFGGSITDLWKEYEQQQTVEAKFVKALDKIEAYLHLAEGGVTAYVPKDFHSEYADAAVKAFDEATHHFPEVKDLLRMVKKDLRQQFEAIGVTWIESDEGGV